MNQFLQALRAGFLAPFRQRPATSDTTTHAETMPRSGWPPLSTTSLLRRRCTDAGPWVANDSPRRWER